MDQAFLRAEIYEGVVRLLDSEGGVWRVQRTSGGVEVNIYKIRTLGFDNQYAARPLNHWDD